MIEVNERVDVAAAPQTVWALLRDPRAVVDCVPGATLGELQEDGFYDAAMTIKFGPAKVTFKARFALALDEVARTGQVTARGKDTQGGTRIQASMTFKVIEQSDAVGSSIPIEARVDISGRLALLVESGAAIVVRRLTGEFSQRVAAKCGGELAVSAEPATGEPAGMVGHKHLDGGERA